MYVQKKKNSHSRIGTSIVQVPFGSKLNTESSFFFFFVNAEAKKLNENSLTRRPKRYDIIEVREWGMIMMMIDDDDDDDNDDDDDENNNNNNNSK